MVMKAHRQLADVRQGEPCSLHFLEVLKVYVSLSHFREKKIAPRDRLRSNVIHKCIDQSFVLFLRYELIIAGIICLWHSSNEGWFMQKDFKTFDEVKYRLLSRSVSLYVGDP